MEVTLKPDNLLTVNYRPQKFLGLFNSTISINASVTGLSPAFRVRVWLRETKVHCMAALAAAAVTRRLEYFTKRLSVSSCTHDISMVHLDHRLYSS